MASAKNCVYCGGVLGSDMKLCPHCGGPVEADSAFIRPQSAMIHQCSRCKAPVGRGDIVCMQCGTNLLTGQKVADEKKAVARKPWKIPWLKPLAAILLGATLTALIAAGALYALRDPVGEARRLARGGNLVQATEALHRYLQRNPTDVDAQFLLGQAYWQGQQYPRAAETFEAVARQVGPRDREAAKLAILAGERTQGGFDRLRQSALLRAMTQRYPNDPELWRLLSLTLGMVGDYKAQLDALQEVLLMGEEPTPAILGVSRGLNNDLEGAKSALTRYLQEAPDDIMGNIALGTILMRQGETAAAVTTLEKTLDASPELQPLLGLQLAVLYMKDGLYGKALPLLTSSKNARPNDDFAAFFHALCLQENKLLDEALVAYERLISGGGPYAGQAALQMAVIYIEQNHLDRAASYTRQAAEAGVNTARQSTIQGRIYALQGEVNQAEQAYRRAISMSADYPAAHLELGLLQIMRGAIDEGLLNLGRYLELAQDHPALLRANEIDVLMSQIQQTRQ